MYKLYILLCLNIYFINVAYVLLRMFMKYIVFKHFKKRIKSVTSQNGRPFFLLLCKQNRITDGYSHKLDLDLDSSRNEYLSSRRWVLNHVHANTFVIDG